jgi:PAS domain S-box-containing protein
MPGAPEKTNARLLVVEDEILVATDLERRLQGLGYTVLGAACSAAEAISLMEREPADLVLMDIVLSGEMDGIQTAEIIRERWGVPVVFLTAYADAARLERARWTRPLGYLLKPFNERDLRVALEMALYLAEVDAESQKTHEALRESEERFRTLFENAPLGLFRSTLDGRFLEVNQALADILGYASPKAVLEDVSDIARQIYVDEELRRKIIRESLVSRGVTRNVSPFKRRDGTLLRANVYIKAIRDSSDRPIHLEGIVEDITLRQQALEDLQAQREMLAAIFDQAPYIMLLVNEQGRVENINRHGERFAGRVKDRLLGLLGGEVLGCLNSFHGLGCGRNTECLACPVRTRVARTFETGVSILEEEGSLTIRTQGRDVVVFFLISAARLLVHQKAMVLVTLADVTERKKAQEKVRESEARFKLMYEKAPLPYQSLDQNGNFADVNQTWLDALGYRRDEVIGRNFGEFLHPDWVDHFKLNFPRFKAVGEILGVEFEMMKKDGSWILVSFNGRISRDESGAFNRTHCIFQDITERRRIEEELKESRMNLAALIENTDGGIWSVDREYRLIVGNSVFHENIRKFRGMPFEPGDSLLHPDFEGQRLEVWRGYYDRALAGERHTVEAWRPFPDSGRFMEYRFNPIHAPDGSVVGVTVYGRDITERKWAEEALRESEEKYRTTFESIPDSITITQVSDGRYSYVNDAFTEITGYSRDEVIGKTPMDINLYEDPDARRTAMRLLKEQGLLLNHEIRFRAKDGHIIDSLFSARRITIDNQECLVALAKDVTKHKLLEREKESLKAQLLQAQKMEAIGTLAGGIAHDFNNLLQIIRGYTQILLMDKSPGQPDHSNLSAIHDAGARASDLVRQLLLFSRKAESARRPVDLNQEIDHARRMLERTISKMIDIELRSGRGLWSINADPVQIEQILLNLATNAADAMPDGGRFVVQTDNVLVDGEYARTRLDALAGPYVRLTVSDTGHGMDQDTADKIFEPFFTTKEVGKGTGLGLASVYGIVKSHGGAITCESEPGRGATFHVYFPAIERHEDHEPDENSRETTRGGTERILVVDDEESIRGFVFQALEKFGYTVFTASSGEEALDLFTRNPNALDLVILDIGMPGMGGYKCLLEILRIRPGTRVLITSGYTQDNQVRRTLDAGAMGYVAKPYQLVDFLNKVRDMLDQAH